MGLLDGALGKIPILGDVLGLAVPAAAAAAGVGMNDTRMKSFGESPDYDPNRFNYGGRPGGADADADRYRWWADQAQTRGGERIDYSQANWDRQQASNARVGQQQMADQMNRRAMGLVPSIAEQQADRQMQQAQAAQMAGAASARGAAGLALAQQNAANNVANMQGAISNQAQINAAQERMAAEQAAMGAYGQMRGMDYQAQAQAAQQAQYQAQLLQQQRAQNDAMTLGMTGHERGVREAQLNANTQQQGLMAGSHNVSSQGNANISGKNADREYDYLKMTMGGAQGSADAGAAKGLAQQGGGAPPIPPPKAHGGPVMGAQPYLVGERGPEMIIPANDGLVIPAGPTRQILRRENGGLVDGVLPLYEPPGKQLHQSLDGHGFYADASGDDTPLAGGGLAAMAARGRPSPPPPVVARIPVSRQAANNPKRPMSEEELRRAAALLEAQVYGDGAARMAQGPAIQARSMGGPMMGLFGGGGYAGSGPAVSSIDQLNPDASMDAMGSLRAHSNMATQFNGDPTGGMAGGLF